MSDQGLSIFDDESATPEESPAVNSPADDQPTQVIPAVNDRRPSLPRSWRTLSSTSTPLFRWLAMLTYWS